jgi:lipid-A-disaccharide synthase
MAENGQFNMFQRCLRSPIFFCVGEPSGDTYAALLAEHFQHSMPHIRMYGIGGPEMHRAGVTILKPYHDMQVFGFGSALTSLSTSIRTYHDIVSLLRTIRPGTFIPVAYPGLNLLLCRQAKKMGAQVHYFMPPQIWAWGMFRKHFVRKWVGTVISVFPFEHHLYSNLGINSVLVENPLLSALQKYRRTDTRARIGFMPGSRLRGAKRQLPVMSRVISRILDSYPDIRCVFIVPGRHDPVYTVVQKTADRLNRSYHGKRVSVAFENRYAAMKQCDMLVIASGTASLEAFLMHVPQVFVHRPSFIDYYFLKPLLKVTEYNLVNLVHGEKLVPTCIRRNSEMIVQFIHQSHMRDLFD